MMSFVLFGCQSFEQRLSGAAAGLNRLPAGNSAQKIRFADSIAPNSELSQLPLGSFSSECQPLNVGKVNQVVAAIVKMDILDGNEMYYTVAGYKDALCQNPDSDFVWRIANNLTYALTASQPSGVYKVEYQPLDESEVSVEANPLAVPDPQFTVPQFYPNYCGSTRFSYGQFSTNLCTDSLFSEANTNYVKVDLSNKKLTFSKETDFTLPASSTVFDVGHPLNLIE